MELYERNGAAPGSENEVPDNIFYGNLDSYSYDPNTYPLSPSTNSFGKYHRFKATDLDGNTKLDNVRVWKLSGDALGANTDLKTNVKEAAYAGAVVYATPAVAAHAGATEDMPTSEPAGANLGIGGALAGQISNVGEYTDYLLSQIQIGANETSGKTFSLAFSWEEVP